jgi:hypothetical protein
MKSRIAEAMKWLGIDLKSIQPVTEKVYARMVRIARSRSASVSMADLESCGTYSQVHHALIELRKSDRIARVAHGKWIPLK